MGTFQGKVSFFIRCSNYFGSDLKVPSRVRYLLKTIRALLKGTFQGKVPFFIRLSRSLGTLKGTFQGKVPFNGYLG